MTKNEDIITYIQELKHRFQNNPEKIDGFYAIMKQFKRGRLCLPQVKTKVTELFDGHWDLLRRFNKFLPRGSEITFPPEEEERPKMEVLEGTFKADAFMYKVMARLQEDEDRFDAFLHILYVYKMKRTCLYELYFKVERLFHNHQDLVLGFLSLLPNSFLEECLRSEGHENKEGDGDAPVEMDAMECISEPEPFDCERYNPSYHRGSSSEDASPVKCRRNKRDAEVLKDVWGRSTSGREDRPFKHRCIDKYEEAVFQCEDDRVEMDVLIGRIKATIGRTERLLEKIKNEELKDEQIRLEDYFTALDLGCIERLYDDMGPELMTYFRTKPSAVLQPLLETLKSKQEEWMNYRTYLTETVWKDVNAQCIPKIRDSESSRQPNPSIKGAESSEDIVKASSKVEYPEDIVEALKPNYEFPVERYTSAMNSRP